jgi:hypothetical protein
VALCVGTFFSDYCSPNNQCCGNLKTLVSFVMYLMFPSPFDVFDFIREILKSLILKDLWLTTSISATYSMGPDTRGFIFCTFWVSSHLVFLVKVADQNVILFLNAIPKQCYFHGLFHQVTICRGFLTICGKLGPENHHWKWIPFRWEFLPIRSNVSAVNE